MRIFLVLLSVLGVFSGIGIFLQAKSAIHEIEAFVLFLISSVLFVGAAIVEAIYGVKKRLIEPGKLKPCPRCAEEVKKEAKICRFCGYDFIKIASEKEDARKAELSKKIDSLNMEFDALTKKLEASNNPVVKKHFQDKREKLQEEIKNLLRP